ADTHHARIYACDAPRNQAREWLATVGSRIRGAGEDETCRAIADTRCVAGGDYAIWAEDRLELGQYVGRRVGTGMLVACALRRPPCFWVGDRGRDDFIA